MYGSGVWGPLNPTLIAPIILIWSTVFLYSRHVRLYRSSHSLAEGPADNAEPQNPAGPGSARPGRQAGPWRTTYDLDIIVVKLPCDIQYATVYMDFLAQPFFLGGGLFGDASTREGTKDKEELNFFEPSQRTVRVGTSSYNSSTSILLKPFSP